MHRAALSQTDKLRYVNLVIFETTFFISTSFPSSTKGHQISLLQNSRSMLLSSVRKSIHNCKLLFFFIKFTCFNRSWSSLKSSSSFTFHRIVEILNTTILFLWCCYRTYCSSTSIHYYFQHNQLWNHHQHWVHL